MEVLMRVVHKESHETEGFTFYIYKRTSGADEKIDWTILYQLQGPQGTVSSYSQSLVENVDQTSSWGLTIKESLEGSYDLLFSKISTERTSDYQMIEGVTPTINIYPSLVRPGQFLALYIIKGAPMEYSRWEYVNDVNFQENEEIWMKLKKGIPPPPSERNRLSEN